MTMLQELEECMKSDSPSYMEFLYRYDPKKKQVFAFYEGDEDSSFYHNILKKSLEDDCDLEEIVAGCKNNVLKLHEEFDWSRYNSKQIVFFVDRDLSYWLNLPDSYGDNVFVTDEYSVENYVVNRKGFEAWLLHFEGFARARRQEIEFMLSEYDINIKKFKNIIIPVMAKAIVAKRYNNKIRLSDFKIKIDKNLIWKIENNHIDFEFIEEDKIFYNWGLTDNNSNDIKNQIEEIKNDMAHYSVRGKWILHFMAELGEYMRLNPSIFAPSLYQMTKLNATCSVHTKECFSAIAPYCTDKIPESLNVFLNNTYRKYFV